MKKKSLWLVVTLVILVTGCASPQKKYRNTSDSELKLRRTQLVQQLSGWEIGRGAQGHRSDMFDEKEQIERELLRRYQAGDKAAYLPVFGQ